MCRLVHSPRKEDIDIRKHLPALIWNNIRIQGRTGKWAIRNSVWSNATELINSTTEELKLQIKERTWDKGVKKEAGLRTICQLHLKRNLAWTFGSDQVYLDWQNHQLNDNILQSETIPEIVAWLCDFGWRDHTGNNGVKFGWSDKRLL